MLPPPERNLIEAARALLEAEVGDTQRQRGALRIVDIDDGGLQTGP